MSTLTGRYTSFGQQNNIRYILLQIKIIEKNIKKRRACAFKETTESVSSASYLDIFLEFDSNGDLSTRLYDKRDDFNFTIINFPHLDSNIPLSPAYGVYISQLIRYARACSSYGDFVVRHSNLSCKLINQGYSRRRLVSSFKRLFGRCHKLVDKYNVTLRRMITDGIGDICLQIVTTTYFDLQIDIWRVPHVGQDVLTLSKHPTSPLGFMP